MQKVLAWTAIIGVALMVFISVYFAKDAYEVLPGMPPKPFENGKSRHGEEWYEFKSPDKFKLKFPTVPQHATESIVDPKTNALKKYDMYVSAKGTGGIFMLTTITFPEDSKIEDPDAIFKKMIEDMVNVNPSNQLKNKQEGTFKNLKAVDFSIANEDVQVKGKEFINGQTLYVLAAMQKTDEISEDDVNHFFNSFEFFSPSSLSGNTPFPLQN